MGQTDRGKVYLLICALSLVFSYLIITLNFFPYFGFALSFLIFIFFSYKYKKVKDSNTKLNYVFAILFSLLLFIRSESLITFLNFSATLFFGLLMLIPLHAEKMGFLDYIYAPLLFFVKSVLVKSEYNLEFKNNKGSNKTLKIVEVVFGILISLILLLVVLPLLSSANPFFQKIVIDFWKLFDFENLLKNIGYETFFIWMIRTAFFLFFVFIIPKVLTLMNKSGNYSLPQVFKQENLPLLIPKLILAIILFVCFITQLQFYFASDETLKGMNISYSQHTREVFGQLSLVAGIVLLLIYNSRLKDFYNRILNWTLGVQGIFLALMDYKSVFEYINAWGLTYARLYGLTFATWITGFFILFFDNYRKGNDAALFVKKTIIFSGLILLLVNILNFDFLIYNIKKAKTGQGIDYTYLSTLSPDSLSYKDQIDMLERYSDTGDYSKDDYNNKNPLIIIHKIENLKRKYSKFDLRTMNLLDFWQYQQIKSVDTQRLRTLYEVKFRPMFR